MTPHEELDPAPASSRVHRSALVFGGIAVLALVGAVVLYATSGPPYGVNIGGGALYLLGLLSGLIASVLLWVVWSERRETVAPHIRTRGLGTAAAALVMVSACTVVSLGRVASGTAQLVLMGVTAAVLAVAVLLAGVRRPR